MKKMLVALMVFISVSIFSTVAYAEDTTGRYAENVRLTAHERTDVYALDFYKYFAAPDYVKAAYVKQANIITTGLTNDYAKVKAIHDWVSTNMYYDYYNGTTKTVADSEAKLFPGTEVMKRGICENFAGVTMELYQAAGFPAKDIQGIAGTLEDFGAHAWVEVYVDNRWVFVDTTWDCQNTFDGKFSVKQPCTETYFDMTMAEYSETHVHGTGLIEADAIAWHGSLYIVSDGTGKVVKEIKNYALGGLVTSTYGYNANDMYSDINCTKHWNFATDKVGAYKCTIYVKVSKPVVKTYTVTFNSQGGTAVKALSVNANSTVTKPATTPTRKGCKFVGWYKNSKCTQVWNFRANKITANTTIYAGWKKN